MAVVLVHLLLGFALSRGLRIGGLPALRAPALTVFEVEPPPPPPPPRAQPRVRPKKIALRKPGGGSAPPGLRARPTEIVAPRPVVPLPVPQPVVVTKTPDQGAAPSRGEAPIVGPGTGSGGLGRGRGGGYGDGEGYGRGGGGRPPRQIKGRIRDSDYPSEAGSAGIGGVVEVRYRVEVDGRATGCSIERSSGNAVLDATTCRLIEERFRFRPSQEGDGRAVPSWIVQRHEWVIEQLAAEPR